MSDAPGRRPFYKRLWFKAVVAVVVLASCGWLLRKPVQEIRQHQWPHISPLAIGAILVLYLAMRFLNGQTTRAALGTLGHRIGRWEAFLIFMISTYANLLIPRAGVGTPAVYLKLKRGVRYVDFGLQMLAVTMLLMVSIGIWGPVCLLAIHLRGDTAALGAARGTFLAMFGASLLIGAGSIFIRVPISAARTGKIARFLRQANETWRRFRHARGAIGKILLMNSGVLALRALRLQMAFWAIGSPANFLGAFVASALADLVFMASVTPGALGFREYAIASSGPLLMPVTAADALLATVLDRVVWTAGTVVVGQIGIWTLIRPARQESILRSESEPDLPEYVGNPAE